MKTRKAVPRTVPGTGWREGAETRLSDFADAGQPYFLPLDGRRRRTGTVEGLIPFAGDDMCSGTLSAVRGANILRLEAKVGRLTERHESPLPTAMPRSRALALLDFHARTRLTRARRDPEDGTVWLRASSYYPEISHAGPIVRALAADLSAALQDEVIQRFFDHLCSNRRGREGGR